MLQYYYHPDHLGSSSYITDKNGEVIQHTEYIAFGEVLVDEHSTTNKIPYLFNGKELDYETGLYYYGARYYDPKVSIFLNVDPLVEKTGTPYAYTYNNPIRFIDPDGREGTDWIKIGNRIFYDGSVNGTYEAQQKYGKDATAITGYHVTKGDFTTHYYLGKGGTVTTISGNLDFLATTKSVYGMRDIDTGAATIEGKPPIIQATIRQTPATNSMEYAMTTPSGRLAVAGYHGLEGATYGIASEFLLGKIGLSQGLAFSRTSPAVSGGALEGLGVQTSFSSSGMSIAQSISSIPSNYLYMGGLRKGQGYKFSDPATRGSNQILIEYGSPASKDPLHRGPYIKINMSGAYEERIPLKGNPVLNLGK